MRPLHGGEPVKRSISVCLLILTLQSSVHGALAAKDVLGYNFPCTRNSSDGTIRVDQPSLGRFWMSLGFGAGQKYKVVKFTRIGQAPGPWEDGICLLKPLG